MLEVDVAQLRDSTLEEQQYWLHAIEAARQAGTRAMELTEGATNNWDDIIRDDNFAHLPTTTPIPTEEEPTAEASSCLLTNTTESLNVQSLSKSSSEVSSTPQPSLQNKLKPSPSRAQGLLSNYQPKQNLQRNNLLCRTSHYQQRHGRGG